MPSIEYSGMKVSGGKAFAILTLLGALGSGAWAVFEFWPKTIKTFNRKIFGVYGPQIFLTMMTTISSVKIRDRYDP